VFVVAVVAIITGAIQKVLQTKAREESRREIAAYVAEGTMTVEQGEKLLAAGPKRNGCGRTPPETGT
jgi:hypothetical protein